MGGPPAGLRTPELLTPIAEAVGAPSERPRTQVTSKTEFLPAAGFWLRLVAFAVDALWMAAVAVAASFAAGGPTSNRGIAVQGAVVLLLSAAVPLLGLEPVGDDSRQAPAGPRRVPGGGRLWHPLRPRFSAPHRVPAELRALLSRLRDDRPLLEQAGPPRPDRQHLRGEAAQVGGPYGRAVRVAAPPLHQ